MIVIDNTLGGDGTGMSRMERWWKGQGFLLIYKAFRSGKIDPALTQKMKDVRDIEAVFNLKGFQFGNWVTNEDRFNYLAALGVCLHDLNKVLKFKGWNLGLDGELGVAFGARGKRGAVAHYEPATNIINLTRYKESNRFARELSKPVRFVNSGGVGAFAHEYAHFLDYFFGSRIEVDSAIYSLSDGSSTNRAKIEYDPKRQPMRYLTEEIIQKAYWTKDKKPSTYYERIRKFSELPYFVQRTEIIARLFEQYIGYKLKQIKIQNQFLNQTKYTTRIYMTNNELKEVVPLFDKLIAEMRKQF